MYSLDLMSTCPWIGYMHIYTQGIHPVHTPYAAHNTKNIMHKIVNLEKNCAVYRGNLKNWPMIKVHERKYLSCGGW